MIEFHSTLMGRQFFDGTMPRIASALERLADVSEKLTKNDLVAVASEFTEGERDKAQRALIQIDALVEGISGPGEMKAAAIAAQRLLKIALGEVP